MTEKVIAFVVVLKERTSNEDAEKIKELLSLIQNVGTVRLVPEDMSSVIAWDRARTELRGQVLDVLYPK